MNQTAPGKCPGRRITVNAVSNAKGLLLQNWIQLFMMTRKDIFH